MAKRKVFIKTDLTIPKVEHVRQGDVVEVPTEQVPPIETAVFVVNESLAESRFNFADWYGAGIDQITYACQRQIERFLAKQDAELSSTTILSYCQQGLRYFLEYLVVVRAAVARDLYLGDISRSIIDGYLAALSVQDIGRFTQRSRYLHVKSVLKALCARGLIAEVVGGENATFPSNPFPGTDATTKGHKPFSSAERKQVARAIKHAIQPLFAPDAVVTSDLLAYALLIVALHTGRNTTPLLEMRRDAIKPHPKADTSFLVLYKRRGHSKHKVPIRDGPIEPNEIESVPTLRSSVAVLVRRVIELTDPLRSEAPGQLRDRVWLFRARAGGSSHANALSAVTVLSEATMFRAIKLLVGSYDLRDADGKPLQLNVSRLRKTFINRVYELVDGDVVATAHAAGNTPRVVDVSYLRPGEEAAGNWVFLGKALTQELLTSTLGSSERTPVGQCSDPRQGEYAPKNRGGVCMSFLNCVRCKNYVVTADDLYRLFSFYWRLLSERSRMDPRRWKQQLSHIVRLIDRDIVEKGVSRGILKREAVDRERERARTEPHPFWRSEFSVTDLLEIGAA